ncbi:hypothetical protein [Hydrocarboniphaga sp.]|uniref:hypothetical protein n=1 Tax=Hydrocarboniphaga sp. TaxID=2033016 RepID=UPI003D147A0A
MDAVNRPAKPARLWKDLPLILPISVLQGGAVGAIGGLLIGGPAGWLSGYTYTGSAWTLGLPLGVLMTLLLIAAGLKPEPARQKPGLALVSPDQ